MGHSSSQLSLTESVHGKAESSKFKNDTQKSRLQPIVHPHQHQSIDETAIYHVREQFHRQLDAMGEQISSAEKKEIILGLDNQTIARVLRKQINEGRPLHNAVPALFAELGIHHSKRAAPKTLSDVVREIHHDGETILTIHVSNIFALAEAHGETDVLAGISGHVKRAFQENSKGLDLVVDFQGIVPVRPDTNRVALVERMMVMLCGYRAFCRRIFFVDFPDKFRAHCANWKGEMPRDFRKKIWCVDSANITQVLPGYDRQTVQLVKAEKKRPMPRTEKNTEKVDMSKFVQTSSRNLVFRQAQPDQRLQACFMIHNISSDGVVVCQFLLPGSDFDISPSAIFLLSSFHYQEFTMQSLTGSPREHAMIRLQLFVLPNEDALGIPNDVPAAQLLELVEQLRPKLLSRQACELRVHRIEKAAGDVVSPEDNSFEQASFTSITDENEVDSRIPPTPAKRLRLMRENFVRDSRSDPTGQTALRRQESAQTNTKSVPMDYPFYESISNQALSENVAEEREEEEQAVAGEPSWQDAASATTRLSSYSRREPDPVFSYDMINPASRTGKEADLVMLGASSSAELSADLADPDEEPLVNLPSAGETAIVAMASSSEEFVVSADAECPDKAPEASQWCSEDKTSEEVATDAEHGIYAEITSASSVTETDRWEVSLTKRPEKVSDGEDNDSCLKDADDDGQQSRVYTIDTKTRRVTEAKEPPHRNAKKHNYKRYKTSMDRQEGEDEQPAEKDQETNTDQFSAQFTFTSQNKKMDPIVLIPLSSKPQEETTKAVDVSRLARPEPSEPSQPTSVEEAADTLSNSRDSELHRDKKPDEQVQDLKAASSAIDDINTQPSAKSIPVNSSATNMAKMAASIEKPEAISSLPLFKFDSYIAAKTIVQEHPLSNPNLHDMLFDHHQPADLHLPHAPPLTTENDWSAQSLHPPYHKEPLSDGSGTNTSVESDFQISETGVAKNAKSTLGPKAEVLLSENSFSTAIHTAASPVSQTTTEQQVQVSSAIASSETQTPQSSRTASSETQTQQNFVAVSSETKAQQDGPMTPLTNQVQPALPDKQPSDQSSNKRVMALMIRDPHAVSSPYGIASPTDSKFQNKADLSSITIFGGRLFRALFGLALVCSVALPIARRLDGVFNPLVPANWFKITPFYNPDLFLSYLDWRKSPGVRPAVVGIRNTDEKAGETRHWLQLWPLRFNAKGMSWSDIRASPVNIEPIKRTRCSWHRDFRNCDQPDLDFSAYLACRIGRNLDRYCNLD